MKHSEITCPFCRIGFGGIKASTPKEKPKTTFEHLDLFWSYEAGLIKTCKDQDTLLKHLVSVDDRGNPTFDEEFTKKLAELKEDFMNDPSYITNDVFDYDAYYVAFVDAMNYGNIEGEDEEFDREHMTGARLKELYDGGTNLKDALRSFIKKTESQN
jgi:hypothetical protein